MYFSDTTDEFKFMTKNKKYSLHEIHEGNLKNIKPIDTTPEYIFKIKDTDNCHKILSLLRVGKFIGMHCFISNSGNTLYINGWANLYNENFRYIDSNFHSRLELKLSRKQKSNFFLYISENDHEHMKLKLLM